MLLIACASVAGLLGVLGFAVAILGGAHARDATVQLSLTPQTAFPKVQSAAPRFSTQMDAAAGTLTITQPVYAGHALLADPALIEQTENGPLPRVASDGRTPMAAYAAPVAAAGKPKIAVVITGLGISVRQTDAALSKLPSAVTLAFAPYADGAQSLAAEARKQGHEILAEVPMEPYDFPDSDPGPRTLRAGGDEQANIQRLAWALTRFTGYTGVVNMAGGRLLSDPDSLSPVMTFLTRRGLLFYDDGSAPHSIAPEVAHRTGASFAQGTVAIDAVQNPMEIDRRLSQLEEQARSTGSASGTGAVYPVTLDRVALWAQGLSGRGFVLVPASAIVAKSN
ncbi:MAG TPA: divergent polysaccharide deacetylase family protein [Rhizomicrobium sp.]